MVEPGPGRTRQGRPSHRGVSVEKRAGKHETRYIGRYTLPSGKRTTVPGRLTWHEAFEAAKAVQVKVDRARYRNPHGGEMTFGELVEEHYLPLQGDLSPVTVRNITSHLGDGTGRPRGKGAKAEKAARHALLTVFGGLPLELIGPQEVRLWQSGLLRDRYQHGSILAKRSLLRAVLELARVNGWLELNPVDAVPLPRVREQADKDRVLTPQEWLRVRAAATGRGCLLLLDLTLDTGLRFSEVAALRAKDLLPADDRDPQHLWIRQAVTWPGERYSRSGGPWEIKEPKSGRFRRVAVSEGLFADVIRYVDTCLLEPDALVFDAARLRSEHSTRRQADPLPERFPHGRYTDPDTGRSGEHGRYNTYSIGCRCPYCRNAYTEYRFWWRRRHGAGSRTPWLEPGFLESRAGAVDPVSHSWFTRVVWRPAVEDAALDWSPTFHNLRHAMVSWSLEAGASPRSVQLDAGHASLRTTEVYVHRVGERVSDARNRAMQRLYVRPGDPPLLSAAEPVGDLAQPAYGVPDRG